MPLGGTTTTDATDTTQHVCSPQGFNSWDWFLVCLTRQITYRAWALHVPSNPRNTPTHSQESPSFGLRSDRQAPHPCVCGHICGLCEHPGTHHILDIFPYTLLFYSLVHAGLPLLACSRQLALNFHHAWGWQGALTLAPGLFC